MASWLPNAIDPEHSRLRRFLIITFETCFFDWMDRMEEID
jgi:hypothetical protein